MEQRFGKSQVCSVGTYSTFQIKQAISDLYKFYRIPIPTMRRITKIIDGVKTQEDFLKLAARNSELNKFLNSYPEMMNYAFILLGQQKAASIHACAMMVFPKEKTMYEWCPIRVQKNLFVSEWEGGELDEAGFLKEDILGIEQLDKFQDIISLIEKNTGRKVDLYKDIPLDDKDVYRYFGNGWLGDVFQFSAKGLRGFTVKMKPKNIHELSDCVALFRPGVLENGYHNTYLKVRSGEELPTYRIGSESILSKTFGVFIYQESVMALLAQLADFDLVTSDIARKALGKKKLEVLLPLRDKFVEGYVSKFGLKGVTKEYALDFWSEIEKASSYLFNKSHSVCYATNAFNSLWLKVHYPLEFWSVALSRASMDDFPSYISEIMETEGIEIKPVEINKSDINIVSVPKTNSIYWALNATSQVGEKAQVQIIEERNRNGEYFSLGEFVDRHTFKGSAVNKSTIENLIYAGAFDEMEEMKQFSNVFTGREFLLGLYRKKNKVKIDKEKDEYFLAFEKGKIGKSWWWLLQQKNRSGFAFFDYKDLVREYLQPKVKNGVFYDMKDIQSYDGSTYQEALIGGYVLDVEEKESKKGTFATITLESNYQFLRIIVFADDFEDKEEFIRSLKKSILLVSGKINYDNYKEEYVMQINRNSTFVKLSV